MNCKACNTRVSPGTRACPHCGHAQPQVRFSDQSSRSQPTDDPADSHSRLSPSSFTSTSASESGELDVELEDEVELPLEDAMAMGADDSLRSGARPSSARPSGASNPTPSKAERRRSGRDRRAEPEGRRESDRVSEVAASPIAALPMDAEQLRHLIGEQPDLLEPGLRVLGEEGRRQVGIGYGTEVGDIDLLARSEAGDWVVVMVSASGEGSRLVSDVLHRVGWVRKHLCEPGDQVRAIVLLDRVDEELGYAAAAVANTIAFRTWRVSIQFESVDV